MKNLSEAKLEQSISTYLDSLEDSEFNNKIRKVVDARRILPLVFDWSGWFGLRLNGDVVCIDYEDPENEEVWTDSRVRRIMIYRGSLEHPSLKELVQDRPDNAVNCQCCNKERAGLDQYICYCGGLGWILPGE